MREPNKPSSDAAEQDDLCTKAHEQSWSSGEAARCSGCLFGPQLLDMVRIAEAVLVLEISSIPNAIPDSTRDRSIVFPMLRKNDY